MDVNKPAPPPHGVAAEPDRVSSKVVLGFGVLIVVLGTIAMVLVALIFKGLERGADRKDEASVAAAGLQARQDLVPPAPRLQVYPVRHWKDFQAAEAARLSSYGWMDRSAGVVHVPIERAMELIEKRGVGPLPAAPMAMPQVPTPAAPEVRK
ncbi:MAG: hypothetical protein WAU32_02415 [Thermoanaerobaculia bacterium]